MSSAAGLQDSKVTSPRPWSWKGFILETVTSLFFIKGHGCFFCYLLLSTSYQLPHQRKVTGQEQAVHVGYPPVYCLVNKEVTHLTFSSLTSFENESKGSRLQRTLDLGTTFTNIIGQGKLYFFHHAPKTCQ